MNHRALLFCCIASASLISLSDESLSSVHFSSDSNSVSEESEMESEEPGLLCRCFRSLLSCFARPINHTTESMRLSLLTEQDLEDVYVYRNLRINLRHTLSNLTMVNNWNDQDVPYGLAEFILPALRQFLSVYSSANLADTSRLIGKFNRRFSISRVYAVRNAFTRWLESSPRKIQEWRQLQAPSKQVLLACAKSLEQVFAEPDETSCCCPY